MPPPALLIASLVLALARTAVACDLAAAPAALGAQTARAWIDAAPGPLREALLERGSAFPARELPADRFARLCDEMLPAVAIFEAPPERVFALLVQTERQGEFLGSQWHAVPVSRAPEDHVDRHEIRILFTKLVYHVRHRWDDRARRIWWDLAPSHRNDLREIAGYWELYPLGDDRSLALYGARVDIGPVVPARLQTSLTAKNTRETVESIRGWIARQVGLAGARAEESR